MKKESHLDYIRGGALNDVFGYILQLALTDAEGVALAHVAGLKSELKPFHALCASAVGEAFGL